MKCTLFALLLSAAAAADDVPAGTEWGRIRAYASAGMVFSRDAAGFSKQSPFLGFNLDKNWRADRRLLLNTFFETRLTSVPVSAGPIASILSDKTASLGAGFYAPVLTTEWTFEGARQTLFLAPLARASFDTPVTARVNHFYTASGAGARLGHFRMASAEGTAPELVSYVDLLWGRYTNFADPHRRLGIEGTLKVPGAPLIVGFAANVGRSGSARDDLRFFFGTRFDLGTLVAKLKQ